MKPRRAENNMVMKHNVTLHILRRIFFAPRSFTIERIPIQLCVQINTRAKQERKTLKPKLEFPRQCIVAASSNTIPDTHFKTRCHFFLRLWAHRIQEHLTARQYPEYDMGGADSNPDPHEEYEGSRDDEVFCRHPERCVREEEHEQESCCYAVDSSDCDLICSTSARRA